MFILYNKIIIIFTKKPINNNNRLLSYSFILNIFIPIINNK